MEQDTYDVIVIGAGVNGLIMANCLAEAGRAVMVCAGSELPAGLIPSETFTALGCWQDTLASAPFDPNLDLLDPEALTIRPPLQDVILCSDGEYLSLYSQLESTAAAISRWSAHDAQAWRRQVESFRQLLDSHYRPYVLNPPAQAMTPEELDRRADETPLQAVEEEFEHPLVQAALLTRFMVPAGALLDDAGAGCFLQLVVGSMGTTRLVAGRSRELTQSPPSPQFRNRGWVMASSPVDRVLIDGDTAVGVQLATGQAVYAKAVASTLDIQTSFYRLVGKAHLSRQLVNGLVGHLPEEFALFGIEATLEAAPQVRAREETVSQALRWTLGFESAQDIAAHLEQIRWGEAPGRLGAIVCCPSLHDTSPVPSGNQTLLIWQIVPARLRKGSWHTIAKHYAQQVLEWVMEYFPNLTSENTQLAGFISPEHLSTAGDDNRAVVFGGKSVTTQMGALRPLPELAGYRTPITSFYLGGADMHPGAGIEGAAGYVAAQVIVEDL